jgi:hypothetical protein
MIEVECADPRRRDTHSLSVVCVDDRDDVIICKVCFPQMSEVS